MFQYLLYAFVAILGIGTVAAVTAVVFWDDIRDRLAGGLRSKGWHKSVLMDAVVRLDALVGKARRRLLATTNAGTFEIEETELALDQIDDQEVRAELSRRGFVERSVLHLVD